MFTSLPEALEVITARRSEGTPGLPQLLECLHELGDPHNDLPSLHIAGTNGKGSTTEYLRSILQVSGYKVGTFTSPFLVVHNDRIRIDNVNITDADLLYWINQTQPYWEKYAMSAFVIDMLIAVLYFKDKQVDIAVYEVGMGGRLDATNVITPLVSVITNIGYDHMQVLGNTLAEIAYEKAGIIKPGVPVYTTENKEECLDVFVAKAKEMDAPLTRVFFPKNAELIDHELHFTYRHLPIVLHTPALYQVANASLASAAALSLKDKLSKLSDETIVAGLYQANWPGRFEKVADHPLTIIDGAHNREGIQALIANYKNLPHPIVTVFTALKDKPTDDMLKMLVSVSDEVIVTEFDYYRRKSAQDLADDQPVKVVADYREAIALAKTLGQDGCVVITGSLYFISEIRRLYK